MKTSGILRIQTFAARQSSPVEGVTITVSGSDTEPEENCEPQVLTQVVIPKNITVHLGKPAASALNVTVFFRNYIANVASSEVYPTRVTQQRPTSLF